MFKTKNRAYRLSKFYYHTIGKYVNKLVLKFRVFNLKIKGFHKTNT